MFFSRRKRKKELDLEETLSDDWSKDKDIELVEVSIGSVPISFAKAAVSLIGIILIARIAFIGLAQSGRYELRSEENQNFVTLLPAPRGIIYDRKGKVIADNHPVFSAYLKTDEFLRDTGSQTEVLDSIVNILNIPPEEIWNSLGSTDLEKNGGLLPLNPDLTQEEAIKLKSADLPAIEIEDSFSRNYPDGKVFSSVLGYTGMVSASDINENSGLVIQDEIGKSGAELYYDDLLRGINGKTMQKRDARGNLLGDKEEVRPEIGKPLYLTIDADLQEYFYERMKDQLSSLGKTKGVGLAMNPQNGEILAMLNFPVYDNNVLSSGGSNLEKKEILTSSDQPLFDRAVSGTYAPGSTIKPLVGVAALKEAVITPEKEIFSPGYIDIPNPYKPDEPTRYLDWRYQGNVNLASALAQSSDVYFYELGGGGPDSVGLGITRLRQWWQKFNLGNQTGVDLPGEAKGFLPSPDWKVKRDKQSWLLGDTYNVSIGQGDLLLTPIQLLDYISAIANGGKIYQPTINKNGERKVISDLSYLTPQFQEVRKGMRLVATSKMSQANTLGDLPFAVEGKTGTAQVSNNEKLNAFFVGYVSPDSASVATSAKGAAVAQAGAAPDKQIAVLVLVENAREGSLNAVPVAKDVLNWYYENRIKNSK